MAKELLFTLFGRKAEKVIIAANLGKKTITTIRSVEGRTVLEFWVE